MPYKSLSQARWFFANRPPDEAKRWAAHTPDFGKLPEKVKKKKPQGEDTTVPTATTETDEKKAFVLMFLAKCAAAGLTTPAQIAAAAEKVAAAGMETLGAIGGIGALGAAAGLAFPAAAGYAGGRALGAAGNAMDQDDAESLKIKAEANAYRRRAAEARLNAQVRKIVSADPTKYVVIG